MAARLAAMLGKAKGRNLIERMDVLTPRPFDRCTTATIPQVRLQRLLVMPKLWCHPLARSEEGPEYCRFVLLTAVYVRILLAPRAESCNHATTGRIFAI